MINRIDDDDDGEIDIESVDEPIGIPYDREKGKEQMNETEKLLQVYRNSLMINK